MVPLKLQQPDASEFTSLGERFFARTAAHVTNIFIVKNFADVDLLQSLALIKDV